jgi:monofunctional biosynthetic peptidoglycan transglycosylase
MQFFATRRRKIWGLWGGLAGLILIWVLAEYLSVPDVSALARQNPETTALIERRQAEYRARKEKVERCQFWVPFSQISPYLKRAVLVAEDISFYEHGGYDLAEIKRAIKINLKEKRFARGASTLTQQLAKNLYLSTSKNPLRKLRELFIALALEKHLSKRRIFELYLNNIEWGKGLYGVEAAALNYYDKAAADLLPDEAARLAAMIPDPLHLTPFDSSRFFERKRRLILTRMEQYGFLTHEEYTQAVAADARGLSPREGPTDNSPFEAKEREDTRSEQGR